MFIFYRLKAKIRRWLVFNLTSVQTSGFSVRAVGHFLLSYFVSLFKKGNENPAEKISRREDGGSHEHLIIQAPAEVILIASEGIILVEKRIHYLCELRRSDI